MTDSKFMEVCLVAVREYAYEHLDKTDNIGKYDFDVYFVWFAYTLGNAKAMLSTSLLDGMYYEVTYNKNKNEVYVDAYKKFENRVVKLEKEV